jgi:hypothetical protein
VFPNNETAKTIIGDSKQYFSLIHLNKYK